MAEASVLGWPHAVLSLCGVGGGMYCHEPQKGGASFQRGRSLLQPAKLQTGLPSSSPDGQRKAKRLYPFLPKRSAVLEELSLPLL